MRNLKDGYLIIYVMVLTFITMSIGLSVLSVSSTQYTHVVDDVYRQDATYGAKACASIVSERLTENASFSGFSNQVIFDDLNNSQGRATCSVTVSDGATGIKNADITTTMQRFADDPNPINYRLRAVIKSEGETIGSTDYLNSTIFAGYGGLYTTTDSFGYLQSKNIYSLGKIIGANSHGIGSSSWPVDTITVANMGCGNSTTWPEQCSDQPVQRYDGANIPFVYAKTCAPGQSPSTRFRSTGLLSSCTIPTRVPPRFDKKSFVSSLTNTIEASALMNTGAGGCLTKSGSNYNGTVVQIPAGTRINGNLNRYYDGTTNITNSSNLRSRCTLSFIGPTYVTGSIGRNINLDISNSAPQNATLVVNGKVGFDDSYILSSSSNRLLQIISFYSNNATCSNSDVLPSASVATCLTPAEARLASQVNPSGPATDSAFDVDTSEGSIRIEGVTFYAYYGAVYLGCHDVRIAAIGGQSVSSICHSPRMSGGGSLSTNFVGSASSSSFGGLIPGPIPKYTVVDLYRI